MNNISQKELYKHKANKYYLKYQQCKKVQKGGTVTKISWLDNFLKELNKVYSSDYIITGFGAIILYLHYYNQVTDGQFNNLISNIRIPNDIDFLCYCKENNYEFKKNIGKFTRLQDLPQRSVIYEFNSLDTLPIFIKSFNLTCLSKISYSQILNYKILSLKELADYYSEKLKNNEIILSLLQSEMIELKKKIEDMIKNKEVVDLL